MTTAVETLKQALAKVRHSVFRWKSLNKMDEVTRSTLLNKAWLLHCLVTGGRIVLAATG